MKTNLTVGIIGTGRFASVLMALFSRNPQVTLKQSSRSKPVDGKTIFSLAEVAECDLVFPAVPISRLTEVLKDLTATIPTGHSPLIVSICSVMSKPEEWMKAILPEHVDVLVTHPVFGPDSTKQGTDFRQRPLVWSPLKIKHQERLEWLHDFLLEQEIKVIPMTSDEHDRIMASTQFISFLFGRIGIKLKLQQTPLDTRGFRFLLENQAIVEGDTDQLFMDLCAYNHHALDQFKKIKQFIDQSLESIEK